MSPGRARAAPRSKYGVRTDAVGKLARTVDGVTFASQAEARYYGELKLRLKLGEIRHLTLQPRFALDVVRGDGRSEPTLTTIGEYRGDFSFEECGGQSWDEPPHRSIVAEVKGFKTALYKWKKKHVEAQYGITIQEIRRR